MNINDIDIDLKPFPLDFEKAWKNSKQATAVMAKRTTLKCFKHSKTFSRETMCFSAQVWMDGRNVADVHNDGNGGETSLYFADHAVERNYNDEVKQRLEQWDGECHPIGIVDVIDRVANDMVEAKETAAFKKKVHAKGFTMIATESGLMTGCHPSVFVKTINDLKSKGEVICEICPAPSK
jgi:hypothetical protein